MSDELHEIEQIRTLKARYFRYLDTKQWEKWRNLFADDCVLPDGRYASVDDLVATLSAQRQHATTVHHGHTPEIVMTGTGVARGIWAMSDYVEFPEPATEGLAKGYRGFVGAGHYEEEYRKVGAEWKISSFRLRRLRADAMVGEPSPKISGYPLSIDSDWLP
jgi:hypothetical protein